jgi:hypothetical protein
MHALFFGLEFIEPIFSGNGVLSRSLIRSMSALGAQFTVICGYPEGNENYSSSTASEAAGLSIIRCTGQYVFHTCVRLHR